MKTSPASTILGVAVLILPVAYAMEKENRLGTSRLLTNATTVGIGFDAAATRGSVESDEPLSSIEGELIEALESDEQITEKSLPCDRGFNRKLWQNAVVGEIQLGELLCDSLTEAEDASVLKFSISDSEAITAQKTSYAVLGSEFFNFFSDGISRKVWTGDVMEDTIEDAHRTVSMTWSDDCNVETFLFKVTTNYDDGSLSMIKSVPCEAGSSSEVCIVEVDLDLKESAEPEPPTTEGEPNEASRRLRNITPGGRQLQTTTTIDIMLLYTKDVNEMFGGVSDAQLESTLATAIISSTEALKNSDVNAEFRLVYVGPLPYTETSTDSSTMLSNVQQNEAVAQLRACVGADLVQLVGSMGDACGRGYYFNNGISDWGFSVVGGNCLNNFSHTHEFGHNLGCYHNRENTVQDDEFSHGWRYCTGSDPYRTIMSYWNSCIVPRVNYFSNPDVILYDKPTGQDDADNAGIIELNMPTVAGFETPSADPSNCGTAKPTPMPTVAPTQTPTPTPGLVDASERTEVTVSANAYDEKNSERGGCDPDGCEPRKTRDAGIDSESRWSCINTLIDQTCRLMFEFDNAQDIVDMNIAFYKGDQRTRAFGVKTWATSGDTSTTKYTSSGETIGFETFSLGSDETTKLVIFPVSPNEDDWLSISEVEIMVL